MSELRGYMKRAGRVVRILNDAPALNQVVVEDQGGDVEHWDRTVFLALRPMPCDQHGEPALDRTVVPASLEVDDDTPEVQEIEDRPIRARDLIDGLMARVFRGR